jgi:hypothetical protein
MSLITVIGRGHSGTRAMSHTLSASGVYMGEPLNGSGDLIPPDDMYDACRVFARHVTWKGGLNWNWDAVFEMDIPEEFTVRIHRYLRSVLDSDAPERGWKIPETTLCFPWIMRMFPDAKYIFWVRDPRDCVLGAHVTDELSRFGIEGPTADEPEMLRAFSWIYQYKLVKRTPQPRNWIEVRFEDFVLDQDAVLGRLENFLGIPLTRIPVRPEAVGRWRRATERVAELEQLGFLTPALREYGYPASEDTHRAETVPQSPCDAGMRTDR